MDVSKSFGSNEEQKQPSVAFCVLRLAFCRRSVRKGVLRNLLKKRLWQRCFPVNFAKFFRTPFL